MPAALSGWPWAASGGPPGAPEGGDRVTSAGVSPRGLLAMLAQPRAMQDGFVDFGWGEADQINDVITHLDDMSIDLYLLNKSWRTVVPRCVR